MERGGEGSNQWKPGWLSPADLTDDTDRPWIPNCFGFMAAYFLVLANYFGIADLELQGVIMWYAQCHFPSSTSVYFDNWLGSNELRCVLRILLKNFSRESLSVDNIWLKEENCLPSLAYSVHNALIEYKLKVKTANNFLCLEFYLLIIANQEFLFCFACLIELPGSLT